MRNTLNKDNDHQDPAKPNDNMMKRPLTLDLNKKIVNHNNGPPILSTPDVNLCKLGSPELENYILNTNTLETPTPSSAIFPSAKVRTNDLRKLLRLIIFLLFIDHNRARRLRERFRGRIKNAS